MIVKNGGSNQFPNGGQKKQKTWHWIDGKTWNHDRSELGFVELKVILLRIVTNWGLINTFLVFHHHFKGEDL